MEVFSRCVTVYPLPYICKWHKLMYLFYINWSVGLPLLLWVGVSGTTAEHGSENGGDIGTRNNYAQAASGGQIYDYLHTLRRSHDELFRKIDWLTKVVEEKDHEDYQFRLKFSRKVHTLEGKVLYMEQTFTQKVEEVVQKKVDELMVSVDNKLRYHYYNVISGSSSPSTSTSTNSRNSHGSAKTDDEDDDDSVTTARGAVNDVQNDEPLTSSSNSMHSPYHRYQQPHYQLNQQAHHPQPSYKLNNQNSHWGFYEHPITQKRVRDSQTHLFGYNHEPPTRDLPRISLMATIPSATLAPQQQQQEQENLRRVSDNVKGGRLSSSSSANIALMEDGGIAVIEERDVGHVKPSKFMEESQKKFESYDVTLRALRENVTNLENALIQMTRNQNMYSDNSEIHKLIVDTRKDVASFQQKHQEMLHRVEHFTVEIEKAAARREHAVNESLRELSSQMRKQIASVKAYTKKQIQNKTSSTSTTIGAGNPQISEKLRCAQAMLDEFLAQNCDPKAQLSQRVPSDIIADQANSGETGGYEWALFVRRNADSQSAEHLIQELATQRKDITELKSEIGRLNVSQILLMRTVDEETLKRTVRPRDCTEIRLLRNASSGIYSIFPRKNDVSMEVHCDMETDGGGWTLIQRRGAPIPPDRTRESFAKSWAEYERGFGSLQGDYWLGLSNMAVLCRLGVQELRIELTNWSGETRFATYQYFKISNASQFYKINVKGYSGTAGDSLSRHNGMAFSTSDHDHDADPRRHCAKTYFSGWWYYSCFESNLNGLYTGDRDSNNTIQHAFGTGIIWHHWMGNNYSLKSAEMKIRNRFI